MGAVQQVRVRVKVRVGQTRTDPYLLCLQTVHTTCKAGQYAICTSIYMQAVYSNIVKGADQNIIGCNRKLLHTSWSPEDNVIAVAATNNLCLFSLDGGGTGEGEGAGGVDTD